MAKKQLVGEEKICFCIADVSGKGIAAAMIMANFQALVQNLSQQYKDLETMVIALNEMVLKITKGEKYLTFFIALADLKLKKYSFSYTALTSSYKKSKFIFFLSKFLNFSSEIIPFSFAPSI